MSVHWPNLPLNVGRALLLLLSALAAQDALFTRRWYTGRPRRTGAARLRRGALRERVAHAIVGGEHGEQRRAACVGSAAFFACPSFPGTWMAVCLSECSGQSLPMRVSRALRGLMGGLPACRIGGKAPTPRRAVATGAERARGQGAASISTGARAGSTALASPRDVLHFWYGDTTWALPPKARAAAMADKAYLKVLLAHRLCAPFLRPAVQPAVF